MAKQDVIMIEIKFRVWDKKEKKFLSGGDWIEYAITLDGCLIEAHETRGTDRLNLDDYSIEQYIGLPDKDGREIYEEDIVNIFEGNKSFRAKIEYGSGCFNLVSLKGYTYSPVGFCAHEIEVIGNIHQNPELWSSHDTRTDERIGTGNE